ncbi:MAG: hypothetical protein HYY25_02490 [Candidatus Wallbacteria bacterium]|nr:hypothetical protein [Candidatus Wallbacteria bacterium]
MEPERIQLELDLDRVHCAFLGMGLAAAFVMFAYWGSVVGVSLVKKGIPETMNTFLDSANSTFTRLYATGLSELVLNPEDLGFRFADRIALPHAVEGKHDRDFRRCELIVAGSNLDMVESLSLGAERYTTESFAFDPGVGTITLVVKKDPTTIPDELVIVDATGERTGRKIRWVAADAYASSGATGSSGSSGSTGSSGSSATVASASTQQQGQQRPPQVDRFAPLKAEVLEILSRRSFKLPRTVEEQFKEQDFASRHPELLLRILTNVIDAPGNDPVPKKDCLRALLSSRLYRGEFVDLDERRMEKLLALDLPGIDRMLRDPRGPCAQLTTASTELAAATTSSATAPPQEAPLKAFEYRELFHSEELFRECTTNQGKIQRAAEAALSAGESSDTLDVYGLARSGHLSSVPSCPASGRYTLLRRGAVDVSCSSHGSAAAPAEPHNRFLRLFEGFEKARELVSREGFASVKAAELLQAEYDHQPQNPYVAYLLGRVRVELGEYEPGYRLLRPLSDEEPANVNISYPCGFAYYGAGNVPQAQGMLERALKGTFEASRDDGASKADFFLTQDKAAWALRKATGRAAAPGESSDQPDERPLKFLDFKQLTEPKYPSQTCLEALRTLRSALDPMLEAFMQAGVKERWAEPYLAYTNSRDPKDLLALQAVLQSLSKEYLGLLSAAPPVCPAKGLYALEVHATRALLQCSVHRDLEPDASSTIEPDTPAWQIKAVDCLLFYLTRRKNEELDGCLASQEKISIAFSAWDDPRVVPDLDMLVKSGGLPERATRCPLGGRRPRYHLSNKGEVECQNHVSWEALERWLADWPGVAKQH